MAKCRNEGKGNRAMNLNVGLYGVYGDNCQHCGPEIWISRRSCDDNIGSLPRGWGYQYAFLKRRQSPTIEFHASLPGPLSGKATWTPKGFIMAFGMCVYRVPLVCVCIYELSRLGHKVKSYHI